MRALLQRVISGSVTIDGETKSQIGAGLVILLGIEEADDRADVDWLVGKISRMRIFSDEEGLMNRSILDAKAAALVVSQFTLHASIKKGNRPSFIKAARPEQAIPLYESFVSELGAVLVGPVVTGEFGADMKVALVNDGPVTIWIDSRNRE
ncbi:MAG: D-tyrosyl-tRNA(Tyr) deacylase [Verrucomicrobiales bacterium]|jgi:D-tyrosyl-tRNA(Tyr) deacylase